MRSSVEFKVKGKTHGEIVEQVHKLVCGYLSIDSVEDAMSAVDVEVKVQQEDAESIIYIATAHVRIK
jgi:hypothetical protein